MNLRPRAKNFHLIFSTHNSPAPKVAKMTSSYFLPTFFMRSSTPSFQKHRSQPMSKSIKIFKSLFDHIGMFWVKFLTLFCEFLSRACFMIWLYFFSTLFFANFQSLFRWLFLFPFLPFCSKLCPLLALTTHYWQIISFFTGIRWICSLGFVRISVDA